MANMGSNEGQTYCLRWNNHKANLVEILDALIKMESYVDCTLVVEDQIQFKAHRVVLAANSPYFQSILQDVPMDHCSILIPGVQAFEMRALLEYMYTGEVNVTQSQIPKIMKIAEQLEVKGLFDMADLKEKFNKIDDVVSPRSNAASNVMPKDTEQRQQCSPTIPTSTSVTPPQNDSVPSPFNYKSQYPNIYAKSPGPSTSDRHAPWPLSPHLPSTVPSAAAAAMLSSVYEAGPDMNPLKRKKISSMSSMLMSRDTPILRNVLAQSHAADSPQPMPLMCQPIKQDGRSEKSSSENCNGSDYNDKKLNKYDEPHSPYTDKSFEDDCMDLPPNYGSESRLASYVPQQQQKPEWKRYKQYTRSDILSAIECVRNGMSALQASRKYGVPSRTLYDKVKKLGITTGRPMNRTIKRSPSNSGGQGGFHFGLAASAHPYGPSEQILQHIHEANERDKERENHLLPSTIPHPAAALLDPAFLQQAFEARGSEIGGREALHAMALAAAAHAAANGISTSPSANGTARSPSPMKYHRSHTPPAIRDHDREHLDDDEEDHVEDLSVGSRKDNQSPVPHTPLSHNYAQQQEHRRQQLLHHHQQQAGVIVPPMTKLSTNGGDDYSPEAKSNAATDEGRG